VPFSRVVFSRRRVRSWFGVAPASRVSTEVWAALMTLGFASALALLIQTKQQKLGLVLLGVSVYVLLSLFVPLPRPLFRFERAEKVKQGLQDLRDRGRDIAVEFTMHSDLNLDGFSWPQEKVESWRQDVVSYLHEWVPRYEHWFIGADEELDEYLRSELLDYVLGRRDDVDRILERL
jgi:hypothetical protein